MEDESEYEQTVSENIDVQSAEVPDPPVQAIQASAAPKASSFFSSLRSTGHAWRLRLANSRRRRQASMGRNGSAEDSATRSVLSLSTRASNILDSAQRWLGRTRRQRFIKFLYLTGSLFLLAFLVNILIVLLGLFSLYRGAGPELFSPTLLQIGGLCDEWMKIDFAGTLNGGTLMKAYELVFDQPTVIQVSLVIPDAIRWDSSQNVLLATIRLPTFAIGKTSSLSLKDIRVKLNADYPLGALAMRLADYIREHQFDPTLPLTIFIRVDVSMSTSSLWFPLKIKREGYELRQTIDLAPFLQQARGKTSQVDLSSYAEIASIEFQPEVDPDRIELITRFQYPKNMMPAFLRVDVPALQFDVRSKTTLLVDDPTANSSFATVITHSHTLQAEEHTDSHDNHFAVFVSLSNERAEPLVRFLERLRDGERSFMISVVGSDIPAAPPILPHCSSCTLQRIIKTFELRLPFSQLGISDTVSLDYQKLAALTVQERKSPSDTTFPPDIPVKREKEALSIGIVGLDPQTSSFQIELHVAINFLERLIPFNYHKLKGQLPSIFLRNMLTYTSSRERQSMLAQMGIKHLPGKTDGTATALDFLITVTMSDMTKFIKIAHKLYHMERVSYEELMRELLELKSVLFTGSKKNLASRILSIFEVELPLDKAGRVGFRRSKAVGSPQTPIPLEGIPVPPPSPSNHRRLVHHDVSLALHSSITTAEAIGSIRLHKHPVISAPRIKLFWEAMDLSLFPVSNGSASHFSDVELFHMEVKKGYLWLSLAARNPLTLLHGGNISFSASVHSEEVDGDSLHGIIAAWKYMILQWYNEPQFTRFRVSGSIGQTGKIDMEACLPPRATLIRLTPKNRWEHSPAQASLSDLISSLIQTQLKIVGFSDATLKMLFELPSFGKCKLPAMADSGGIVPIISLHVSLPKITMNICQTRQDAYEDATTVNSPTTQEEREDEDAWWRAKSRKSAATRGPCMVQVSLQPIEANIDLINGRPCDIETRLRQDTDFKSHTTDDLEDEWQHHASTQTTPPDLSRVRSNHGKLSHLRALDPTEALFADHHNHYRRGASRKRRHFDTSRQYQHSRGHTSDTSPLRNLLPLSVVVVSLEDAITAYREITQQQLWQLRISLGNIPTASLPAEQKSAVQATDILLINRFINGIGQMFPVEFPMVMPNKSERPPVKSLYHDAPLVTDIQLHSPTRQSLDGTVHVRLPSATLYHSQLHPSTSEEESQVSAEDMTNLSFLLTVQWGDTIINLRHRNSYLRVRLNQGQIGMRLANQRIRIKKHSLPFFSKHLIADFKMFVDDRDFDSAQLRALLGVLQSAFEAGNDGRVSGMKAGEHHLGLTRAEERVSREEIELTVIVGKYNNEFEDDRAAVEHERSSRRRFFHKHQLDDDRVDKYKLNTTLQVSTLLRLANLTYNRYKSGMPIPTPSTVAAELEREGWFPQVSLTVDVVPDDEQARVIQLPCLFPRICKPELMGVQGGGASELKPLFVSKVQVHHAFQMGADLFAHGLARIIHKLNLRRHPSHVSLRVRTESLGLNIALNDIDAVEVIVPKLDIKRRAELTYPGFPPPSHFHGDRASSNSGIEMRDTELIFARLYLPRYYHDITSLLAPISVDPIGRINLGRVPQFQFKGLYHNLLHTPVNAMPTNERTLATNLFSSILCGISPETLLGTMPISLGSGGMKVALLGTDGDEYRLEVGGLQILNPSGQVTLEFGEPVSVTFDFAGYSLLRAEVLGSPFRMTPGYNTVAALVTISRTAFGRLSTGDDFAKRLFFDFAEGILFGRPMDVTLSLHIGGRITLSMPVHFPQRTSYVGGFDLAGIHPYVVADGMFRKILSNALSPIGDQAIQMGKSVWNNLKTSLWKYWFEPRSDQLSSHPESLSSNRLIKRSDEIDDEEVDVDEIIAPPQGAEPSPLLAIPAEPTSTIKGRIIATVGSVYNWMRTKIVGDSETTRLFPRSENPPPQPESAPPPGYAQRIYNYVFRRAPTVPPPQGPPVQPARGEAPQPLPVHELDAQDDEDEVQPVQPPPSQPMQSGGVNAPLPAQSSSIQELDAQDDEDNEDVQVPQSLPSGAQTPVPSNSSTHPTESHQPASRSSTPVAVYEGDKVVKVDGHQVKPPPPSVRDDADYGLASTVNRQSDIPQKDRSPRPLSRHHSIGSPEDSSGSSNDEPQSPYTANPRPRPSTALGIPSSQPPPPQRSATSGGVLGSVWSSLSMLGDWAKGRRQPAPAPPPPVPSTNPAPPSNPPPVQSTSIQEIQPNDDEEGPESELLPTSASQDYVISPSALATQSQQTRTDGAPPAPNNDADDSDDLELDPYKPRTKQPSPASNGGAPAPSTVPASKDPYRSPPPPPPGDNSLAVVGHGIAKITNRMLSLIPPNYKITNPNEWQMSFLTAQLHARIENRDGPNWGFSILSPTRGFTAHLLALLGPPQCRADVAQMALKAGPVTPEASIDKPTRSSDPPLSQIASQLLYCAHQYHPQSIFNIDANGHTTGNIDYVPVHGYNGWDDLKKAVFNSWKSDGACISLDRSVIGIAFTDKQGKRTTGEAVFSAPFVNLALSPYTDPCRHSGSCRPQLLTLEAIGPVWESRSRSTPNYSPSFPLPLVTRMHERGQIWRVQPIPIYASWRVSFEFTASQLAPSTTNHPPPSPSAGLALVFRATNVGHQGERVTSDGAFGCENIPQSSALVLDFTSSSISWMHNGDPGARLIKHRGGMPVSLVQGRKYSLTLRYDPGVPRFLVDVHDTQDDIVYSSIFKDIDLPTIIGDEFAYIGITAAANHAMHAIHIFNWQLHPVAPDFTRTRIHYLEKYSPTPGQLGAFLIQLSDACDDHLMQAPRRIFVRLRRLSLVRAWLYDIYQIPPSEVTGSTVNSSAKQPVAKGKSNLPPHPHHQQDDLPPSDIIDVHKPVIIDTSLSLIVRQGLYLVRYPALAHGRYAIDIAMPPFNYHLNTNDSYPTPSRHQVDEFEWITVQHQQVYIRSAFHAFDKD